MDGIMTCIGKKHGVPRLLQNIIITKESYNVYKYLPTSTINYTKRFHYLKLFNSAKNDISTVNHEKFRTIFKYLHKDDSLMINTTCITDSKQIADNFSRFFHDVPVNECSKIQPTL